MARKVITTFLAAVLMCGMFTMPVHAAERTMTQEEELLFERLVFAEAGIEDEEAQLAVAAVILNRIESSQFPNTLKEVAFQKYQFSCVKNERIYVNSKEVTQDMISEETKNAVQRALDGEDPTEEALRENAKELGLDEEKFASGGALYFYNPSACSKKALEKRASISVKVKFDSQNFYKIWD